MSCEMALKIYEQAKDRLDEYVNQAPSPDRDRMAAGRDEQHQEIERLKHAVEMARQAYEHARAEHVDRDHIDPGHGDPGYVVPGHVDVN